MGQIFNLDKEGESEDRRRRIEHWSKELPRFKESCIKNKDLTPISEDFEREAEGIEEGETPLNVYGSLKEFRWATIMKKCGRFFKEFELKLARRFIEENRVPPDVLSVQIQRRISVISPVEMESAEATPKMTQK